MDRNREARRVAMTTPNGLPRRRHRTGSPRGSPEHDGAYELQESSRFRERTGKKDRDRENEKSERDRWSRNKRRMGEKYMNGSNREDGVDDSSEVDEEEETDDAAARLIHPNPASIPSSASPSSTLTSHRKSYPPTWKAGDEMVGVSIPRKARSASTKRSYDCWISAGEQSLRQASSSPVASSGVVSPSAASVSPTSSSLSVKKNIANGSKQRPPKSTKSPSTIQEDIEIEVAEVLFGLMRQSQGPSKPHQVMPNDSGVYGSREVNTSTDDFKSRATSRVSNSSSSAPPPFSDTSPKRKKPRLVNQHEENTAVVASHGSPIPTAPKSEADLQAKPEIHLPKLENNSDFPAENGGVQSALLPATGTLSSVENRSTADGQLQGKDLVTKDKIKEVPSQEKETLDAAVNYTSIKQITTATGDKESCREEKFEIDLMAPPQQSRSSPVGGRDISYHREPMAVDGEAELDLKPSDVEKVELKRNFKGDTNLHCDSKLSQQLQNQPPLLSLKPSRNDTSTDKTAQTSFFPPLSMPVPAGWPIGVPPIGYVAPQQGAVVSVDGKTMAPTAIQPPRFHFTQPRPVRCATHGYIAKDINIHQKLVNPIWPANAGAPSCNLNVVPAVDLHATAVLRGDVTLDKGQAFAFLPGQQSSGKDKGAQPATNIIVEDGDPKKQFFQSLPHGGPSNMLHGPATFFYPLSQQEVAAAGAAPSTCANSTKPLVMSAGPVSASTVTSAPNATAPPAGQASPATLSFSYPNMAGNETQYMAIMGNGAYQFPIPAHVGAAQAYRGPPAQVMSFFNGSYYPSPIMNPSQLQQQQQAPPPQQIHQKPSISTASSSSQKQPQNQLQRSQGSNANGLATNSALPTFPTPKSRASEMQQHEVGREGSPSTANSCLSTRPPNMIVYGQNFTMPFNPANFALLTPPVPVPLSGATVGGATNSNHTEKEEQVPQAFALSFASVNGAMPAGFDNASKAQNQVMLQSLPEAARNNYHIMTAAAAAQATPQKMNYHGSEDRKSGAPNSSSVENDRKGTATRASASSVQSISFSRPDLVETSVATVSGNNVADTAARSSSLAPGSAHSSRSSMPNTNTNSAASNSHHQPQPFIHLQKQQQFAAAATRNKVPVASNGSVYPDHFSSPSATGAKFTNAASAPNVQSSNTQSQWKNHGRTTTQVSSPSMSTSITASMKNLGQQHVRPQHGQTHISFGGNQKASTALQVQQGSPSPSMMVGSPLASSVFKGHGGSPRLATSASVGGKSVQASSVTTQQGKNSPSVSSHKSSPVAGPGRNLQSSLGNPHMPASSSMGSSKPQLQQQPQQILQQPQLSKQSIQQTQMFFNASYMQTYSTASGGAAPAASGFQLQRHQSKQQQQSSKSQGAPTITVSTGMHLNSTLVNASTNDPVKAVAAAAVSNIKGGAQSQHAALTSGGTTMVVSSGFTYVHAVPAAAVQVKPAEQKQPAA